MSFHSAGRLPSDSQAILAISTADGRPMYRLNGLCDRIQFPNHQILDFLPRTRGSSLPKMERRGDWYIWLFR